MKPMIPKWASKSSRKGYHNLMQAIKKYWYAGDQYYCVCCNSRFARFLDMKKGSHPRPAVICPGCGSVERHRSLMHFLQAYEKDFFPEGCRILYIAPMMGLRKYLKNLPGVSYLGADLSSSLADVHFDLQDIPYPEASFDFCICSHTLAHVRDDKKALSELHRVLSEKGVLIVMERTYDIPTTKDLGGDLSERQRLEAYEQADRWRNYGQDFPQYLAGFGFKVEEIRYAERLSAEVRKHEALDPNEVIYLCRKKQ